MFDDTYDGFIFFVHTVVSFLVIASVAKAKTSPDIFGEREMRGPGAVLRGDLHKLP